jgi:hypothetical protein
MNHEPRLTGAQLRRRVRSITAGVAGAAVLTSAGIVATLALAEPAAAENSTDPTVSSDSSDSSGSADESDDSPYVAPRPGTGSGSLIAPNRAPTLSGGQSHARSGGS